MCVIVTGSVRSASVIVHRAVSGEGITYYPRQNGGAWNADSDGFVSNCPVSNVHELTIATHVISNNATTDMDT